MAYDRSGSSWTRMSSLGVRGPGLLRVLQRPPPGPPPGSPKPHWAAREDTYILSCSPCRSAYSWHCEAAHCWSASWWSQHICEALFAQRFSVTFSVHVIANSCLTWSLWSVDNKRSSERHFCHVRDARFVFQEWCQNSSNASSYVRLCMYQDFFPKSRMKYWRRERWWWNGSTFNRQSQLSEGDNGARKRKTFQEIYPPKYEFQNGSIHPSISNTLQ